VSVLYNTLLGIVTVLL